MPPFRLELPEKKVVKITKKILYTKNQYDPRIKITDWNRFLESQPVENNPYEPGHLNYFTAHYNSFGFGPKEPYRTTTQDMLEQLYEFDKEKKVENPNKFMLNYFTYKDTLACENQHYDDVPCPKSCAASYETTMQLSYRPPYPYPMKRFGLPVKPYLQYRRFKLEDPQFAETKFYDENFHKQTCLMQKHKKMNHISYVPWLGINSDGSAPPEFKQKCYELDYLKERL